MLGVGLIIGFILGIVLSYLYFRTKKKCRLTEQEEIILRLVESSRDVIYHYQIKPEMKWKYMSASIDKIMGEGRRDYGYNNPMAAFENIHPDDVKVLEDKWRGTIDPSKPIMQRWSDSQGNYRWFEEYATPIYDANGDYVAIEGIIRDVTDKINLEHDLEYRATHDALTNLYNREYFELCMDKFDRYVDTTVAIILCDLDDLKLRNDVHGHKAGDQLIREASMLLNKFTSENSIVARIGGDEFAFVVSDISQLDVEVMMTNITEEITTYNANISDMHISVSKGYAFTENSLGKMQALFVEADKNMYVDKKGRKLQSKTV